MATTIVDELEHKEVEDATKVDKAVILDSNESQISGYDQMSKNNSETIKDEIDKIPRATTSDSKVLGFELNQNQKTKRRKKMTKKSDFRHYFDLVNVTKTSKKDGKSFISKMKPLILNFYSCPLCSQWKTTDAKEFEKHHEKCNPTAKIANIQTDAKMCKQRAENLTLENSKENEDNPVSDTEPDQIGYSTDAEPDQSAMQEEVQVESDAPELMTMTINASSTNENVSVTSQNPPVIVQNCIN